MKNEFLVYAFRGLVAILFTIVAFFSVETYKSLQNVNSNVIRLQLDLGRLKAGMLTEERIRDIAKLEIISYHERHDHGR